MQLGRYHILKQLATGSIADVLLARASGLEGFARHVVIKRIRPELAREERFVRAFLDEARISASLHHQNIVQVHDIGEQDGAYYFAMEYVHGEDLRRVIHRVRERGVQVPLEHVIAIVSAAANGLHYAHEKVNPSTGEPLGIVHRDVSPANILVGYDGSVKITDFGLARAAQRSTTTATGSLEGKASYMSPEQCTGRTVDRRSDTFSLGVVLFELLTAQRLFKGKNDFMTMAAVVEGDVPRPSTLRAEIPPALDEIVMRALARVPGARYQTTEALRESLEAFSLAQEMRTSAKALADYLVGLFGERPEPWTPEAQAIEDAPIDVESTYASGLVSVPRSDKQELLARHAPKIESPMALAQLAVEAEQAAADEGAFDDHEVATTVGALDPEATADGARSILATSRTHEPPAAARESQRARGAEPAADPLDAATIIEPSTFDATSRDTGRNDGNGRDETDDGAGLDDEHAETVLARPESTSLPFTKPGSSRPSTPSSRAASSPHVNPATPARGSVRGDNTPIPSWVPVPATAPRAPQQPQTPQTPQPPQPPQPPTAPQQPQQPPPAPTAFGPDARTSMEPAGIPRAQADVYVGPPAPPLSLAARARPYRVAIVIGGCVLLAIVLASLFGSWGEIGARPAPVDDPAPAKPASAGGR